MKEVLGRNLIHFRSGKVVPGTCINCETHPCIHLSPVDYAPHIIEGLPFNRSDLVCPANAINLDPVTGYPSVISESCFGCYLCAARCPTGAIGITENFSAEVNVKDNASLMSVDDRYIDQWKETEKVFSHVETYQNLSVLKSRALTDFAASFSERVLYLSRIDASFENLLIRNLLIGLGIPTIVRVTGDTNFRVEMLSKANSEVLVTEVNFDPALIETPRSLLDDIAVLSSRYGISKNSIIPVSICWSFPNKRTDYYEVITDIKNVLQVEIKTLSVTAIFLLNLFQIAFDQALKAGFYVDREKTEIATDFLASVPEATIQEILQSQFFGAIK